MTRNLDSALLMLWLVALTIGFVMVASASAPLAGAATGVGPFVARHGVYVIVGIAACAACAATPLRFWQAMHRPMMVLALVIAVVVLIPGLSQVVNGARRWITIGPVSIQPAEIGKFVVVVYLAGYLSRNHEAVSRGFVELGRPLVMVAVLSLLYLMQPDFGSVVVIAAVSAGMLFIAGARIWHFLVVLAVVGGVLALLTVTQPYRLERMVAFLDPWSVAFDSGYQLTQALIAFGRGDWLGLGLGEGIQKAFYLTEAHNDFIFAVIVEELGLIGATAVLALLATIVVRIFQTAGETLERERYFAGFLAYGAGLTIGVQCLINVGVNTGTLPTKGLTLPFVSFGGNSLVVCCALLGLVIRSRLEPGRTP